MEHIISEKVVAGWTKIPVWCETKSEHYYLPVDLSRFNKLKQQSVDCRCGSETFLIQRKDILIVDSKKKENAL